MQIPVAPGWFAGGFSNGPLENTNCEYSVIMCPSGVTATLSKADTEHDLRLILINVVFPCLDEPLSPHMFTDPLPAPVTIDGKRTTLYDTSIPGYGIGRLAVATFGGKQYQFVLDSQPASTAVWFARVGPHQPATLRDVFPADDNTYKAHRANCRMFVRRGWLRPEVDDGMPAYQPTSVNLTRPCGTTTTQACSVDQFDAGQVRDMKQHPDSHLWRLASVTEERVLLPDERAKQALDLHDSLYHQPWYGWARVVRTPEQEAPLPSDHLDSVTVLVPCVWTEVWAW